MQKFDAHFKMNESDVIEYSVAKGFFEKGMNLSCKEIGDGNINYVFRVEEANTGSSIIVKHADIFGRLGHQVSIDRNRIEAELLMLEAKYAPGLVPEVYLYDPVMCCVVMRDLKGYENMRYALIEHKTFSTFVEDITSFMAQTLIRTTDIILTPTEKKELQKRYVNPTLCAITEQLVYTEPYTDHDKTNVLHEPNIDFFHRELYEDMALHLEIAKLKEAFKSNAQALIHGDLHTGSLFVKEGSTIVLDPEFAFYGPMGYDVGNIIANLIFAWTNAAVTMTDETGKKRFMDWVERSIAGVADRFYEKAEKILSQDATERFAQTPGFIEWYLSSVMCDTAGVAGLELNRRIVGLAKVRDIAGIEDSKARALAERICVLCAKEFIMNRMTCYQKGSDYLKTLREVSRTVL
ncbi:MAG: S-methyl-5-thioribose kinase [Oscillospiraceae bacterium]|nr:S-methyl-5-thioribose kinase [Oscillospiraceae bacterium]